MELNPVNCGCGGEARTGKIYSDAWTVECTECGMQSGCYDTETEAITAWNLAMLGSTEKSSTVERTAKVTRKPEAFFYRCECGYGLCCEKNDMNYCPHCGAKLVWEYDNGNE